MKKKEKIVIINHYGITPDKPGATKHYDLSRFFADKGEYNVEFWLCGLNHVTGKYDKGLEGLHFQTSYDDNGIKIVKIKSTIERGSALLRQINIMVFDFITGLKLLFSRDVKCVILSMPPITFFATNACKFRKIKMVADVEDLWPLFMVDMGLKNKLATKYMEHFANKTYNAADAIEAVSIGMLDFVKNKIKNKKKMMWLAPLGINLELFEHETDRKYIEKYQWKDDFKIIYAGAHGRANDLENVIRTVGEFNKIDRKSNNKISFVFIGDGDNKKKIETIKRELNLPNVYLEDAVPGTLIPGILKNADVCLTNLCKIESFKLVRPNKIFQYMGAARPIICGIWGEARDVVNEANSGVYIDFTNHKQAAQQIALFVERNDLDTLGKNGYEYIAKNGNRKIIFEEFYENVKKVIEQ